MKFYVFVFLTLTLIACTAVPTVEPTATAQAPYRITADENLYAPTKADLGKQIASVTITSVGLAELYDYSPPKSALNIVGYMPSVCNELRVDIAPPDEQFRVFIEVYSLINPDVQCDNVFQQFEATIIFGSYSPGRYTVWINDSQVGDFVSY